MSTNTPQSISEAWMSGLPQFELYHSYASTVRSRFPAFGIRSFEEARFDMAQPLHEYDPSEAIDQDIVDMIVTPESFERFGNNLMDYIAFHGLESWLRDGGSLVFGTNHRQFTDDPITAETLGRIGFGSREKTLQVVSEMICTMKLNLGKGEFSVLDKLCNIGAVAHTVPRLDGKPSEALVAYRTSQNTAGRKVIEAAARTPGAVTVLSVVGRHDTQSKTGRTLYIHEPNRETLASYDDPMVKLIPLCINCPTFHSDGSIKPADIQYELFDPMRITDSRKDTQKILYMFREATQHMIGSNYRNGVKIRRWKKRQSFKETAMHLAHNVINRRNQ